MPFQPPDPMDFTNPGSWHQWKSRFQRYALVTKLKKEDSVIQVSTLIYCMGPEAEQVFSSFTFEEDSDKDDYDKVLEKFDSHFIPKKNIIFERAKFIKSKQTR